MSHDAPDDLDLLAARLHAGVPLRGFDGREIPLRDPFGRPVTPIQAARSLLDSGARLLPLDDADELVSATLARARNVEQAAGACGFDQAGIASRVTAVLVSAAVRASAIAQRPSASPSEINRAVLAWFESFQLGRQAMPDADDAIAETRLYA